MSLECLAVLLDPEVQRVFAVRITNYMSAGGMPPLLLPMDSSFPLTHLCPSDLLALSVVFELLIMVLGAAADLSAARDR